MNPNLKYSKSTLQSATKNDLIDLILALQEQNEFYSVIFVDEGGDPVDGGVLAEGVFRSVTEAAKSVEESLIGYILDWFDIQDGAEFHLDAWIRQPKVTTVRAVQKLEVEE